MIADIPSANTDLHMPTAGSAQLPKFKNPPVIETIIGIEFARLEKFGVPHFGLYWEAIRADFPEFELKQQLDSQIERFEPLQFQPTIPPLQFIEKPEIRCWFVSRERRLIQLQQDRFIYNWRKEGQEKDYPQL